MNNTPFLQSQSALQNILVEAKTSLEHKEKLKFQRSPEWRNQFLPDYPGVYALYEKVDTCFHLLYVGESGSIRKRMSDICRTVNHTFRRKLAEVKFNIEREKGKKSLDENVETLLNAFFDDVLYVSFIEVNFGRTEIEEFIVTKNQSTLLNSETKRKLNDWLDKSDF